MVLEPCTVLEPEDIPIPDADDLVIEILTDQMIDLDESMSGTLLEIFAVTGGDKKRVEVMDEEDDGWRHETHGRRAKDDRDAVAAGAQSVRRRAQERVADKDRVIRVPCGV